MRIKKLCKLKKAKRTKSKVHKGHVALYKNKRKLEKMLLDPSLANTKFLSKISKFLIVINEVNTDDYRKENPLKFELTLDISNDFIRKYSRIKNKR